jgi:hypothetical protein
MYISNAATTPSRFCLFSFYMVHSTTPSRFCLFSFYMVHSRFL